jgi:hypothetical protein
MQCLGLKRRLLVAIAIGLVISGIVVTPALAVAPHEDPATAKSVFSGIALFRYYSGSLDFVLQREPVQVEARLNKMPFANIPQGLEQATDEFASSSTNISYMVVDIVEGQARLRTLLGQFRLEEAAKEAKELSATLSRANSELGRIETATKATGLAFRVSSAPEGSDLRQAYDEVLDRINRIRAMLNLQRDIFINLLQGATPTPALVEILKQEGVNVDTSKVLAGERLKRTEVTLKIMPVTAFVGDIISFDGTLTAEGAPLAGREVDILLNGSQYASARTEAGGHYAGSLLVPYWYIPEIKLQALFYPRDKDIGVYISSTSPETVLKVLFYEAKLELSVADKAYPGLETEVSGRFDYGQSPAPAERRVQIYLDDALVIELQAQPGFARKIKIDPGIDLGKHVIAVSAQAVGRYAPVEASAGLTIVRATPVLDLSMPRAVMIPGGIDFAGRLYSEVGPLSGASVTIGLGKSQEELESSEDGTFDARLKVGMGFDLIGSEQVEIRVLPKEPWNAPLITTRSLVVVNVLNLSGLITILVLLGIYVPAKLRKRFGLYTSRRIRPAPKVIRPEPMPAYSDGANVPAPTEDFGEPTGEPRERILYWYRLVVRLIQRITRVFARPQQTLREFVREAVPVLGPIARYLGEFTRIVERLFYSRYEPTEGDLEKIKGLPHNIEEELKGEAK